MATLRFSVAEADAGTRLDRALAERTEIGTRSLAERLLLNGAVTVDGASRPKSHRLDAGSVVEVELPAQAGGLEPEPVTVRLAYEDEHLLVVDKPAALTVHPGSGASRGTLAAQLLSLGAAGGEDPDRPGIVHRLDRDTSGLLVVARTDEAYAALGEAVRRREVDRRYLALVRGAPAREPAGSTLRSDVTAVSPPGARSTPTSRARRSRGSRWSRLSPDTRSSTSAWRPAARIRSVCIWLPSTFRYPETSCTA